MADGRIAELEKALVEERAKLASERVAYPNLCMVAVEQFKGSTEFQMAIDAAVAWSLVKEGEEEGEGGWAIGSGRWR